MPKIPRARHTGYDWQGHPIVRVLNDVTCADVLPASLGLRQFSYTADGTPIEAYAWICCDAFCDASEVLGLSCYKLPDLWPLGPGPGITKRVAVYLNDVASCLSAVGKWAILDYDAGDDKWHGTVTLRGCTLTLAFSVNVGDTGDPGKFTLEYSGGGDSGTLTVGYFCSDPLVINFGQATLPHCCTCPGGGPGTTDVPAEVNFYVAANCRPPRLSRQSYFDWAGRPVVVEPRSCLWDTVDPDNCAIMTCPVVFSVSNVDSCACLAGDWTGNYFSGGWEALGVGACSGTAIIEMLCSAAGKDSQGRTLVRLDVTITCGVDNTGTGYAIILATDLETLDVTIPVTLTGPSGPTCTDCEYVWNEMAGTWSLLSGCSGDGCGECPESPSDPPASPTDGQHHTEPCPGGDAVQCCIGTVNVRVTRA